MIKACIFDLDGVIVDTAHYHFLAWKRLADDLGIPFNEQDNERLKGVSRMRSLEIILELGGKTMTAPQKESLTTKKNQWFVDYVNAIKPDEVFPGVVDMIRSMKARKLNIALASSSKNAAAVIRQIKMEQFFDVMIDGTMIRNTKPDPEIFLLAASRLHRTPSECLVFEDAEAGVEAAVAAGMKCVGVGSPQRLSLANVVVKTTSDFKLELLNTL